MLFPLPETPFLRCLQGSLRSFGLLLKRSPSKEAVVDGLLWSTLPTVPPNSFPLYSPRALVTSNTCLLSTVRLPSRRHGSWEHVSRDIALLTSHSSAPSIVPV